MLRNIITNNAAMGGAALALLAAGVIVSVTQQDFDWLNRFGALVACVGILIMARPVLLTEWLVHDRQSRAARLFESGRRLCS